MSDSGEGRWTIAGGDRRGVPAPVLSAALYERFASRGQADFANQVLSAMRHEFGGHVEKPAEAADMSAAADGAAHGKPPPHSDALVLFGATGDLATQEDLPGALRDGQERRRSTCR